MYRDYYVEVSRASAKDVEGAIIINEGTENEKILVPMNKEDEFPCVIGARADFEGRGFDTSGKTDAQMRRIFDKIGEILVGYGGYWEAIDEWGREEMKRKDEAEDE